MSDLQTWDAWYTVHQPYELDWWRKAIAMGHSSGPLTEEWRDIMDFVLPFGRVLDIGCGPRPMFAPCVAIEPLAKEYQSFVPEEWWDGVAVYARPAEQRLEQLVGKFDIVICWNCLDHAVGWRDILANMRDYGA